MKSIFMLTEAQKKLGENFLNCFGAPVEPIQITHILDLFLSDEQLIARLGMSKKSLYNYREEGLFSQIPLKGRYYTFLPYLIQDLLELNQKRERRKNG